MVNRIEFLNTSPGLTIIFYYDTDCMDTYSIHNRDHAIEIMEFAETEPEPEELMLLIRNLGKLSIH